MGTSKSAKKYLITSDKARIRHKARKSALATFEKNFLTAIENNEMEEAKTLLVTIFSKLDKAVKFSSIKKNKANRKKTRLTKKLNAK